MNVSPTASLDEQIQAIQKILNLNTPNNNQNGIAIKNNMQHPHVIDLPAKTEKYSWKEYLRVVIDKMGEAGSKQMCDKIINVNPDLDEKKLYHAIRDNLTQMKQKGMVNTRKAKTGRGFVYYIKKEAETS